MDYETILKVGMENELDENTLNLFTEFFSERFPEENNNILSYVNEWARRFKTGNPEAYMDTESQQIYSQILEDMVI